jgi:hypothetical protein
MLLYSLLIFTRPLNLGVSAYSLVLLYLPICLLAIILEYKNTFLRYSSTLTKLIIDIIGVYVFTCSFTFLVLMILKFTEFTFMKLVSGYLFVIPIYGLVLMLDLIILFLYTGFKKVNDMGCFYFITFNGIVINTLINAIIFKIIFYDALVFKFITWTFLFSILSLLILINYCYFNSKGYRLVGHNKFDQSNYIELLRSMLNIVFAMSSSLFFATLGIVFDIGLDRYKNLFIYFMLWISLLCVIVKFYFGNKEIDDYNEWKKMNII